MRLLVTTNGRIYRSPNGLYYTPLVYGYGFFQRYLNVFEKIRLVAHTEPCSEEKAKNMLLVSGPGLEVFEMPFPHGKIAYIKSAWKIQNMVKDCIKGCDAALFRIPDMLAFQIFPVARRHHIPIALEVTSNPLVLHSARGGRHPFRLILKWHDYFAVRKCCKKADCVSYVTSSYLQKIYPSKILPSTNNRYEAHYTSANIHEHEIPLRVYPIVGSVSLLHVSASISGKTKGHREIIEAFISLRNQGYDVKLTLVGGGNLDKSIATILENSKYKEEVIFTGLVGGDELAQLYKNADIFVFPSYREGLPRAVIEAMSWGLPCVCTDIPGCRELLPSRVLVPVMDSDALVDKLKELLGNYSYLHTESQLNLNESRQYLNEYVSKARTAFYRKLKKLSENKKLFNS